jgi:hypothetical protein
MTDILDILRDWHADASKSNSEEADFIKKIIDEISSLRYLNQNPGIHLSVSDWKIIDKTLLYAQHRKSCAYVYGRCTCGFDGQLAEYDRVRNPENYKDEN